MRDFSSVAIVGAGLIGTSTALAVRERIPQVRVDTLDRGDDIRHAADADLIVLSAPVTANHELLAALRPVLDARTLITDTGSTKASTLAAARGLRFIGGHPVAGGTDSGPSAAHAHLFDGCPWILTPPAHVEADDLERLRTLISTLGATPVTMEAAEHDRLFAFISHLPQLVVSALMDVIGERCGADGLRLAGAGLRDSTRLAGSPPGIWMDIASTNRAAVGAALDALIGRLVALRDDGDGSVLRRTFEGAARWRSSVQAAAPVSDNAVHGDPAVDTRS